MGGDWWAGVELRHLVALDAVAREGSFRRAAERLGYVQSAISHQIAALELLVGRRLIDRSRGTRPLSLTPSGEVLLLHADAVISRMRAAQADLAAADGESLPSLRVGVTPDLAQRLASPLLRACGVAVTLHEVPSRTAVVALLLHAELDLALTDGARASEELETAALGDEPFVAVLQRNGRAPAASLAAADLGQMPLIAHAPSREHVTMQLRAHGVEPRFVLEVDTGADAQRLVAAGLGASIVPRLAVDERRAGTALVELLPGLIRPRPIGAVWSRLRTLRPDGAAFVEAARASGALT